MTSDEIVWQRVIDCNQACAEASDVFLQRVHDPVRLIRKGLHGSVVEIMTALGLLWKIDALERVQVLEDLLRLSLSQKFLQETKRLIQSLPKKWLAEHLEEAIQPLLQGADSRDYLMLIGLCDSADRRIATELAQKASQSDDGDIKEVGEDYLHSVISAGQKEIPGKA
jgi:hypothetical protein